MRKLIYFIIALNLPLVLSAQVSTAADQEKLLDYYQSQRFTEAATYLNTIYNPDTDVPKELAQIAYTNLMAGNLSIAEKSYLKLYKQQPRSLPLLFSLANLSQRRGDEAKAKTYYNEIIKIDSTNFNVYKQLASMVSSMTSPEKILYLKKANAIQPKNADVAFDLANSLNLINKNDSAYKVINVAILADSSNMMLLKSKMPICIKLLKIDETIETGNQLRVYGDSSSYVLNNLGKAYFIKKNYIKALNMFKEIEFLKQQNESTLYYTTLCYKELKDYKKAAEYLKLTIDEGISTNISQYYKLLGEIYETDSMTKNANIAYHKSLNFVNDGQVFYNLGLINDSKINNKKSALLFYRRYLKSHPDPIKFKKAIEYVTFRIKELTST